MKASKLISLTVLLFVPAVVTTVLAQDKPKAGDTISGVIREEGGPMMMVNVTERDSSDRIVAHTITDMAGNFSFRLVNPDDRIQVSYVGYENVDIPIDKTFFEINMQVRKLPNGMKRAVYPRDRGIIGRESYTMEQLIKYAPLDYICGYVMKDQYGTIIYGIYLVNEKNKYSLVYKDSKRTETSEIASSLAKELESAVVNKIANIEYDMSNPVYVDDDLPVADLFYDAYSACAVTPDKAAFMLTWSTSAEDLPDNLWKKEIFKFRSGTPKVSISGEKPHAGGVVSGEIKDSINLILDVRVTERDAQDRIVSSAYASIWGDYKINIVDPNNTLCIQAFGYKEVRTPIVGKEISVMMSRAFPRPMVSPETPLMKYANPRLNDIIRGGNLPPELAKKLAEQDAAVMVDGLNYLLDDQNHAMVCYMFWSEAKGDIIIPESITYGGKKYTVTAIKGSAFYNCVELRSISIPESVTTIGSAAFASCIKLESITIPSGVKDIGPCAFSDCSSLKSITISGPLETIGEYTFGGCPLESIILGTTKHIECIENAFDYPIYFNAQLNVPKKWKPVIKEGNAWMHFKNVNRTTK